MTTTALPQLELALDTGAQLLAGVRADQWSDPTPCTQWSVRELVNHLVAGNRLFAAVLQGASLPEPGRTPSADHLGADPVADYRESGRALLTAFAQPGVLERTFRVPAGELPGEAMVHLRLVETLVHGWDLARATGQSVCFPADLVGQELAFTRHQLDALSPEVRQRQPFGDPQPAPDDAPGLDRLAALLGRQLSPAGHPAS